MKVVVSQFQGVENTPGLPLAAGCLVASARRDDARMIAVVLDAPSAARDARRLLDFGFRRRASS